MAPDFAPPEFQDETKRLLGRCLLRLQQYERLVKALYASHELSARPRDVVDAAAKRAADVSENTLGQLIGKLSGAFLTDADEESTDEAPQGNTDEAYVRFRATLRMSPEDFSRTTAGLRELVSLRNRLVHHFIDDHDLWTEEGCRAAEADLRAAFTLIDNHFFQLREWAKHIEESRRRALEMLQSGEFIDFVVFGIRPDGTVDWDAAPVVGQLRNAFEHLNVAGWARVDAAQRWMAARDPELTPRRYLCHSWRQVIHESRQFDLKYLELSGIRVACYRPRRAVQHH